MSERAHAMAAAPLAIDLSTDATTTGEWLLIALVIGLFALGLLVGKWRDEYRGVSDESPYEDVASQQTHVKALIGQLESQTPTTLSWRPSELEENRHVETIRDALEATPGTSVQADRATLSQAAREISAAWSSTIQSVTNELPVLAVRLVTLAGGIAIFGPIAVYTIETWRAAVQSDGTLGVDAAVTALTNLTQTFATAAVEVATSFPYIGRLWSLLFSFAIIVWNTIYNNPLAVALLLALTAVAVTVIDRRLVRDHEYRTDRVRAITAPRVALAVVTLWAIGVAPTALLGLFGAAETGATIGFTLAVIALLFMLFWATREFVTSIRTESRVRWPDDANTSVVAWLTAKRIGHALTAVGVVLIPTYLGSIILSGRALEFVGVLAGASIGIKVLLASVGVAVAAIAAYRARNAWPDLKVALGDLVKDRSVKLFVFGSGLPFFTLALGYLYIHSVTDNVGVSLGLALVAAVIARGVYLFLRAVRYKASLLESTPRKPMRVVDHCYTLTDADGGTHHFVRVNGVELAHTDPEALAEAVADAHEDIIDPDVDDVRPMVAKRHARHLRKLGIVRIDSDDENIPSTMDKLRGEMRRRTFGGLQNENGRMPLAEYSDLLNDLPPEVVDEELPKYRFNGTTEGTVIVDDGYVRLVN
jgi:hypothetical protein